MLNITVNDNYLLSDIMFVFLIRWGQISFSILISCKNYICNELYKIYYELWKHLHVQKKHSKKRIGHVYACKYFEHRFHGFAVNVQLREEPPFACVGFLSCMCFSAVRFIFLLTWASLVGGLHFSSSGIISVFFTLPFILCRKKNKGMTNRTEKKIKD